jgi:hypothetical protein
MLTWRLSLIGVALVAALFGASAFAVKTVRETAQESTPLLETRLDPDGCPQPCWQGVRPGTRMEDLFFQQLRQVGLYTGTARTNEAGVLLHFDLEMRGDITLADVLLALGEPSHATLRVVAGTTNFDPNDRRLLTGGVLYFGNGLVEVEVVRLDREWRFSPEMIVRRIRYHAPNPEGNVIPIGAPRWHGFGSRYGDKP